MKKYKILLSIMVLVAVVSACETLSPIPLILTVWTGDPTSVTGTSATVGAAVTSDGGKAVTAYGVCYSRVKNAVISNSDSVVNGASIGTDGAFSVNITGLANTDTYYARAFATNSVGTVYGNWVSINTLPLPTPVPTINSTTAASAVTQTTATSGGNIAYGGATITEMGVVVSTSENPTTSDTKFTVGSPGAGPFTANITGLTAGTTYHIRAYAINAGGTGYGNDVVFKTND